LIGIGLAFVVAWGAIGYRMFDVQVANATEYAAAGEAQRVRNEELAADRGTIFDRDLVELAVTIDAITVIANPSLIDDPDAVAALISPYVETDLDTLVTRLSKDSQFAYIDRHMERGDVEELRRVIDQAELVGFGYIEEPKRVYPAGSLGAQLLGFVQVDDNSGLEGLEAAYDTVLTGVPGRLLVEKDPYGRVIPQGEYFVEPAEPGADLVLTIDREIQFVTEKLLAETVAATNAAAGTVVVIRPATGEILALAASPTFDPNDRTGADREAFRNRAVADVYEPGSTLKVVTVAAALEEGRVTPRTVLEVPQEIEIHDKTYADVSQHDEALSVAEIVAMSSNVGTIMIQAMIGNEAHHRYLDAFGLGHVATGQIPTESAGNLRPVRDWCDTVCGPSTAIGYRVDVTPIQMAGVFATLANDGVWVQPHVVTEVISPDGSRDITEPVRRPVVSEDTARRMRYLLQGVVETGTGQRGQVQGYTVAGKTGTTEKFLPAEQAYSKTDRIASFIGMAPVDQPEIVVAVVLDSPHGEGPDGEDMRFGGVSAAPLFSRIVEAVLQQLGVPPDAQ
jgi:cell division protein FtsI (penicillin-binding protein 3)